MASKAPDGLGKTPVGHGAKLKDSNMANYGSKAHHDAVRDAAKKDKAFDEVLTIDGPGLKVWRAENKKHGEFGVKKWPKSKYGSFYNGDSFLVLHTQKKKRRARSASKSGKARSSSDASSSNSTADSGDTEALKHDIYFWLGSHTSIDERGVVAYKAFELEEILGGNATQHRLIEGRESPEFLKCFDGPIHILEGGIESGFNHVKAKHYEKRLLWIKGRGKHIRVKQVPTHASSLNHGDCFVLDCGLLLFQYHGDMSSGWEKRKAHEVVMHIRSTRSNQGAKMLPPIIIDGAGESPEFWAQIGGSPSDVKSADHGGEDDLVEDRVAVLYKAGIDSETNKVVFTKQGEGDALSLKMLDTEHVFILDTAEYIFCWVGAEASKAERKEALVHAEHYLAHHDDASSPDTPVMRVFEKAHGLLPMGFRDAFPDAPKRKRTGSKSKARSKSTAAATKETEKKEFPISL